MAITLKPGQKAPDFTLETGDGKKLRLSSLRGKKVVLYFYPRDNTPGCTREACAFRDGMPKLAREGAVVLGVSTDSAESHRKFAEKYDLDFPLLADTEKKVAEKYGAWQEKNMYGKKTMGIVRSTFVIDEEGKILEIFPRVRVDGHFDQVLGALKK
jgi:peroxiredoxin Q/BCP